MFTGNWPNESIEQTTNFLLHSALISESGGSDGIRDNGLLDSALNTPFQTFAGRDLYPTVPEKAAGLGFGLIRNHPFIDGNKRIGAHAMLVFFKINNILNKYITPPSVKAGREFFILLHTV